MEEILLQAIERTKKHGKFRESGFVPGVLFGDNIAVSTMVKFEESALIKVLDSHGSNAKGWINLNDNKKFGFIKEIQRHPVSGKVIHISVQIVSYDHELKLQIPIAFKGKDELRQRQLQLQVYKPEITVLGKMDFMLDAIHVDVSEMNLGDTITLNNLNLPKELKVSDIDDVVYGIITNLKIQPADAAVEIETAEVTEK